MKTKRTLNTTDNSGKRPYIVTCGCQMNDRNSGHVVTQLLKQGYALSEDEQEADVILFNTCGVRRHAEDNRRTQKDQSHFN